MTIRLLSALLFLVLAASAGAGELRLGAAGHHPWHGHMTVIADPAEALTPEAALTAPGEQPAEPVPNYGYAEGAIWARLAYDNAAGRKNWLVVLRLPDPDWVDLHLRPEGGDWRHWRGGILAPNRLIHPYQVIPVELPPGKGTLLVRIATHSSLELDLALVDPPGFLSTVTTENLVLGLMYGAMATLAVYYLLMWLVLRAPALAWYGLYVLGFSVVLTCLYGYGDTYFPAGGIWMRQGLIVVEGVALALYANFTRHFLDTRAQAPWSDRLLRAVVALDLLAALGWTALDIRAAMKLADSMVMVTLLGTYAIGLIEAARGRTAGRWYVAAETAMLAGSVAIVLRSSGILPAVPATLYGLALGSTIENLVFAIALSRRIDALRQAKEVAELEARHQARRAMTDPLTGIGNRAAFEDDLVRAAPGALVAVIDIDGMKRVNDTRGHECGDRMLRAFAQSLQSHLRGADQVYRIGGDEFVILLPAAAEDQPARLRDRLAQVVAALHGLDWPEIGASIGFATITPGDDPWAALKLADRRMYDEKRERRGAAADQPAGLRLGPASATP